MNTRNSLAVLTGMTLLATSPAALAQRGQAAPAARPNTGATPHDVLRAFG